RSGRAVGEIRRDDGAVGCREISGAVPLHGLSRACRRPFARRAGALRRARRNRSAQGALRGVAEGEIKSLSPRALFTLPWRGMVASHERVTRVCDALWRAGWGEFPVLRTKITPPRLASR